MGGWWRWALVSPDIVAPSWMVGESASVNLPLHCKSPEVLFWHRLTRVVPEKGHKTVVVWLCRNGFILWLGYFLWTARSQNWRALKRRTSYRHCNTWISSTITKDSTFWPSPKKRWMCTRKLQQNELSALMQSAFIGSLKTGASGGNGETVHADIWRHFNSAITCLW